MARPRIMMEVRKGALVPADAYSEGELRARAYRVGDIIAADLYKPRYYASWKCAHKLAKLLRENIDAFAHLDEHRILKRLQLEGDIACEHIALVMPGIGPVDYRTPQSLSYASMDEAEFLKVYDAMCAYVAKTYWPEMDAEQIAGMAQLMADAI